MKYIAGPYWSESKAIRESRVKDLCRFHDRLSHLYPNEFFYNPLVNSTGVVGKSEEYWRAHGLHMLALADGLFVLTTPGWEISKGVQAEIAFAEGRMPIHYGKISKL